MSSDNNFTNQDYEKYTDYMITSQRHHTPSYEWSDGIFQKYKPISGKFLLGNNFYGSEIGVNNQTGRAISANGIGYWNNTKNQFNPGKTISNIQLKGALFPTGNINNNSVVTNPQNTRVHPYSRIGEEYRSS
jgi:hypothetical protein